jgi:DNA-binding GntR family transcriptional regulator
VRVPLNEEIRLRLREQILRGEYEPGQRLTEQQTARLMETSQGPVREAFASLAQEGLLVSLPRRGTFVSSVSETEAQMAYSLRAHVEPFVVRNALDKVTPDVLRDLRDEISQMRAAAKVSDFAAHSAADMRFHGRLYRLAGTDILANVWGTISATIRKWVVVVAPQYVQNLMEAADDHEHLVKLLEARNADALELAVSEHLGNLSMRIRDAEAAGIGRRQAGQGDQTARRIVEPNPDRTQMS